MQERVASTAVTLDLPALASRLSSLPAFDKPPEHTHARLPYARGHIVSHHGLEFPQAPFQLAALLAEGQRPLQVFAGASMLA